MLRFPRIYIRLKLKNNTRTMPRNQEIRESQIPSKNVYQIGKRKVYQEISKLERAKYLNFQGLVSD